MIAAVAGAAWRTPLGRQVDAVASRLLAGERAARPSPLFDASAYRCALGAAIPDAPAAGRHRRFLDRLGLHALEVGVEALAATGLRWRAIDEPLVIQRVRPDSRSTNREEVYLSALQAEQVETLADFYLIDSVRRLSDVLESYGQAVTEYERARFRLLIALGLPPEAILDPGPVLPAR